MKPPNIQEIFETETAPCSARRVPTFGQSEIEVNFSTNEAELACCGEVLRPFWADDGRYISVCQRCGQKYADKTRVRYGANPWIGVDLDGTLAIDTGNNRDGTGFGAIGSPIKPMLIRLKKWISEGKTVKIFTARASSPKQVVMIRKWLLVRGLPDLEVTNVKDPQMVELWDDRCVQVMTNLGEPIEKTSVCDRNRQMSTRGSGGRPETSNLLSRIRFFLTL
ncbi:MAG TPA: hypothetical protein VNN22_19655 [Verrucomicrobiae bacterium]|nr:hypothetical protein [Verrucomicrobiae bacterium]